MKNINLMALLLLSAVLFTSCRSVDVVADYDRQVNFDSYKSYAFYKTGIDQVQVSDLDKRRILKAIEYEMSQRGFQKSKDPDILVSIFTDEKERVNVYQNYPWGWGWGGWGPYWGGYWGGYWGPGYWGPAVSSYTEGALYIDLIDAESKQLVWQGKGVGSLSRYKDVEKKERRIREFVYEIMRKYPPEIVASN